MNEEHEEESAESDESTSSQVPTRTTQQWIDGNPAIVNKSLYPAISYWLALTTPKGAPANSILVNEKLLKHGVSVTANKVKNHVSYFFKVTEELCGCPRAKTSYAVSFKRTKTN